MQSDLKITSVDIIATKVPMEQYTRAYLVETFREGVIVKVTADNGVTGIGEVGAAKRLYHRETFETLVTVLRDVFKPLLLGKDPLAIDRIMAELDRAMPGSLYPQSAVSDALYDLAARTFGVPLCTLLGGAHTKSIPVVWGVGMDGVDDLNPLVESVKRAVGEGYQEIKMTIGYADADTDLRRVEAVRKAGGAKTAIRVDADARLFYCQALPLLRRMEEFDLHLVEEPLPISDVNGLRLLSSQLHAPLVADEQITTLESAMATAREGICKVFNTRSAKNGGIHNIRKIAAIAEGAGISLLQDNHRSTTISVMIAAHLCAAVANVVRVRGEFHMGATHLRDEIVQNPPVAKDGCIPVPEGPGSGVVLDEQKIERYLIKL
ncbi:MAG: hypothetical protein HYX90_05700 [Chloroflexi bacterium]|nr:hypothetical protein [Chloroflexota bacterium]